MKALARPSYIAKPISAIGRSLCESGSFFLWKVPVEPEEHGAVLGRASVESNVGHKTGVSPRMLPTLRAERRSARRARGDSVFVDANDVSEMKSFETSPPAVDMENCARSFSGEGLSLVDAAEERCDRPLLVLDFADEEVELRDRRSAIISSFAKGLSSD